MSYITKILKTGAISKTPNRIIDVIIDELDIQSESIVIEFGCGKGEITKHIANKKPKYFYGFEIDCGFIFLLKKQFPEYTFISDSAIEFAAQIPASTKVDYFICTFPLSFYKKAQLKLFFKNIKAFLAENGKVIFLFHAGWLLPTLKKEFPKLKTRFFFHTPPYFLITYRKAKSSSPS
jgi:phospholipid N-methyltransferase